MVDDSPGGELAYGWARWAAISLLRGTPIAKVVDTLVEEANVSEELAAQLCADLYKDPAFEAAEFVNGQLQKLESVLTMRIEMRDLAPLPLDVDRRSSLSRQEFLQDYYAANRPVLLEDVCDQWPALDTWSPEYLTEVLGSAEVEVMSGREADAEFEINAGQHKTLMPFDEYVAKISALGWSNDLYLVANNHVLEFDAAKPLWEDFRFDERYLVQDTTKKQTFLWFGPGGTVTPLHHDTMNILFNQVLGWKRVTLVSPLETHCLSNLRGVYSDVDPMNPDLERFPRYSLVHPLQVTVGPGDTLFIPAGWWHHVQGLETAISVTMTSFQFLNNITWANPKQIL